MELVNQTPAAARVDLTTDTITDQDRRLGLLVAKLTFRFDGKSGRTEIDDQDPLPLFETEEDTDLGQLPSDAVQRRDAAFEVVVLGAAYAKGGRPVPTMSVGLSVGEVHRVMQVTGERAWTPGSSPKITRPVPFDRMPLTFDRAYGGTCSAYMDKHTVVDLADSLNPHGKGFDGMLQATQMAASLEAPPGFPVMDYTRPLPNLEAPEHRITTWDDAPEPYCWATVPQDIAFAHIRFLRRARLKARANIDPSADDELAPDVLTDMFHRAHPDWIIDLPPPGAAVTMTGFDPTGQLRLDIPQVRLMADYVLGEREGTRELAPQMMVLLPEESRLCLVYRLAFTAETAPEIERSFRLRLADGWFQYPDSN